MKRRIDFAMFNTSQTPTVSGGLLCNEAIQLLPKNLQLNSALELVQKEAVIFWVSEADWCMHELLIGLLNITGPGDVTISSYAMSENPARAIAQLKNAGMIGNLAMLLDNRVDVRSAGSFQLIKGICNQLALVKTHAKVTIIHNTDWDVAVIGSANYTENERYESGVISTLKSSVAMQLQWMNKAFANDR